MALTLGTTGIQALDLLGRKVMQLQGAGLRALLPMIEASCREHAGDPAVSGHVTALRAKLAEWEHLTMEIGQRAVSDPEEVGAAAYDYLLYSGYVLLGWWWMRSVVAAEAASHHAAFKSAKRETARFYFERVLPRTLLHAAAIRSGGASLMSLAADDFDA